MRDTNLRYKDCSEMHSGGCSQMTSSCKCPVSFNAHTNLWKSQQERHTGTASKWRETAVVSILSFVSSDAKMIHLAAERTSAL